MGLLLGVFYAWPGGPETQATRESQMRRMVLPSMCSLASLFVRSRRAYVGERGRRDANDGDT